MPSDEKFPNGAGGSPGGPAAGRGLMGFSHPRRQPAGLDARRATTEDPRRHPAGETPEWVARLEPLRPLGTIPTLMALLWIAETDGHQRDLARALGMSAPGVCLIMDRLEELNLAKRMPRSGPGNRLALTARGAELLENLKGGEA